MVIVVAEVGTFDDATGILTLYHRGSGSDCGAGGEVTAWTVQ